MESPATARPYRFAVSATFNAEPLTPFLRFWGEELNTALEIEFAPFNQPLQTLLDPSSVFARNQDGLNVLLVRLEDLGALHGAERLKENTTQLAAVVRSSSAHLAAPLLVVLCPPSHPSPDDEHLLLAASLGETPGVGFLGWRDIVRLYPVENFHDPLGEKLGGIPYTDRFFAALGTALFRHAHALTAPPFKLIALDCDNTLWRGICGEDGPNGVFLDRGREYLQRFMLDQREDGMLLAIVSKNNEAEVLETFQRNPQFPIGLRHFVTTRINWEDKAGNLASIAQELNLGAASFIFLDDNARECAEVEETLPEVLTLNLPADPDAIPGFLNHIWAFDHPVVTEEDRQRSTLYQQSQEFGKALKSAESLTHFIETLQLKVAISPLADARLSRTAQLTQRTNQFNCSTVRRTEAELRVLAAQPGTSIWTVDAADRFGDYGQVGVLILVAGRDELAVETLLLSCRALGRGVEHQMVRHAAAVAESAGLATIRIGFEPTSKNAPARLFLESLRGSAAPASGYRFSPAELKQARITASAAPASKSPKPARQERRRSIDYARIALELSTAGAVLDRVRERSGGDTHAGGNTEQQLAAVWRELLDKPAIHAADNFFDLGGHSLQAVLLLLRIKEQFGVELGIDDVYSGTATLSSIAALIEARQMEASDPEKYASLLAEIEQLSDEEVQALLAEQERSSPPGD